MPAEAAAKLDTALFLKAVTWSIDYLLDPKRGNGKKLPGLKELQKQFTGLELISADEIDTWIYSRFKTTDLQKIVGDQQKIKEVIDEISQKLETPRESAVPRLTGEDLTAAKAAKGRPSALGVLAELEAIEPILRKHQQETAVKLTSALTPQVQTLITSLGIKDIPQDQLAKISEEIANEVTRETLENIPKIADLAQTQDVITDSVIQTLIADPDLGPAISKSFPAKNPDKTLPPEIQLNEEKLIQKVTPITSQIAESLKPQLEKSAVLGSLTELSTFRKPSQETLNTISDNVKQIIETSAPLATPQSQEILKASLGTYLVTYLDEFASQIPKISPTTIPSFEDLQKYKEIAHNKATAKIGTAISQNESVKRVGLQIGYGNLTAPLATNLRLAPPKVLPEQKFRLPTGSGLVLSSDKNLSDAQLALLAHDQEWLNRELKKTTLEAGNFKKKMSLTNRERKIYLTSRIKLAKLQKAQELALKNPKRAPAFRNIFRDRLALLQPTFSVHPFLEYRLDYFISQTIINSPCFGTRAAFTSIAPGSLSFFGKINPGFRFSVTSLAPSFGMGIAPAGVIGFTPAGIVLWIGHKIRNIAGAVLGGLGLFFLALGQAAFTGFLIGATIGATIGLGVGIGICVALGPFGLLAAPVVIPLSMFTGGIVGGTVGGAIALGLFTGSPTAVTAGIGVGVGGTTGAVVGGILGSAFGPLGTFVGVIAGAYIGSFIGGALGYVIGHYVLSAIGAIGTGAAIGFILGGPIGAAIGAGIGWLATGGLIQIKNFFAGTTSVATGTTSGIIGTIGGFFTGAASTVWGGITAAAGGALGFLSGAANFVIGLTGLAPSTALAAVPVVGGISAVAIGGTIIGIVTATTFFNPEADLPTAIAPPGETPFFTVTKSATPNRLENNQLPADITFFITLTAKEKGLTGLQITDELKVKAKNGNFTVTQDKNGNLISPPCADTIPETLAANATWSCQFTITADTQAGHDFSDSVVANTVTVTATPEGEPTITGNTTATVVIGNPPTICGIIERQGPWSSTENNNIDEICKDLDQSPQAVSLLQNAGTIYLIRVSDGSLGSGVCGTVNGGNRITVACNMTPTSFAKYVIIHEMGHVLGNYNTGIYNNFIGIYNQEGLMPTYPFPPQEITWGVASESFAEMISDYVVSKTHSFNPRSWSGYPGGAWVNPGPGWTTFKNDRPVHYNFAKTQIFGGVEY